MLSFNVTTGARALQRYTRDFKRAIDGALEETAQAIPKILADQYTQGQAPSGKANRPNEPETVEAKAEQLGHATPLRGRGEVLSDPARYRVQRQSDGNWHVEPPEEREQAIRALRARGYEVHEVPPAAVDVLKEAIRRRLGAR